MYAACFIDNKTGDEQQLVSRRYPAAMFAATLEVMNIELGNMMKHWQLPNHTDPVMPANKIDRLFQGIGDQIKDPTNTCHFITKEQMPDNCFRDVTYGKFECTVRTEKAKKYRLRLVIGDNHINNSGNVETPTAEMLLVKITLNSVISTPGAKFMLIDIYNFYLAILMEWYEYTKLKLSSLPEKIIQEYKLRDIATNDGLVYVKVQKGMYSSLQAGLLTTKLLEKQLNDPGYFQSTIIPGLWTHTTQSIQSTLVADNF